MSPKKVLMVEGRDDQEVVKHICTAFTLGRIDCIYDYKGITNLIEGIGVRLKESDIVSLGILVDADTNINSRWQSIADRLVNAGYSNVPSAPDIDGTLIIPPTGCLLPKVGVWLMPNNVDSGILEDFLSSLIDEKNQLLVHAISSVASIPSGSRYFSSVKNSKALIHTWLAWQEEPGNPFGTAITAKSLDVSRGAATNFSGWLRRVFFT